MKKRNHSFGGFVKQLHHANGWKTPEQVHWFGGAIMGSFIPPMGDEWFDGGAGVGANSDRFRWHAPSERERDLGRWLQGLFSESAE